MTVLAGILAGIVYGLGFIACLHIFRTYGATKW